jgi:NADPH:quinone reductase
MKPSFPFIPGAEFSGVIIQTNLREKFKVGDRVFGTGSNNLNGYAELVAITPLKNQLFHIPNDLTFEEAASIYMTYPTSYVALVSRAQLCPKEVVLIHAAAGGVGIAAVQIAKQIGAIVIATAGSEEKCSIAKAHGADFTINYTLQNDWDKIVNKITSNLPGRDHVGADVIYDPVGFFNQDTKCIAWNGRILVVGFAGTPGKIETVPANRLLLKGASLVGMILRI